MDVARVRASRMVLLARRRVAPRTVTRLRDAHMLEQLVAALVFVTPALMQESLTPKVGTSQGTAPVPPIAISATALPTQLEAVSSTPRAAPSQDPVPRASSEDLAAGIAGLGKDPGRKRFGEMDSCRFNLLAGYANDFDDASQASAGVGVSWFFVDHLSLDIELLGAGIFQPGPDAAAFNANLLFRWHFVARETWSIYADAGAGILLATEDVPRGGTPINFSPQLGVGVSFDVGNDARLMVGLRWYHISNARTSKENPGRDSLLAMVGLSLPF